MENKEDDKKDKVIEEIKRTVEGIENIENIEKDVKKGETEDMTWEATIEQGDVDLEEEFDE